MTQNIAASVHQRLLNRAHAEHRPFGELLQYFALERFLYRLGESPYAGQFVLKGALMFSVWRGPFARPTRDVDLLGRIEHVVDHVVEVVRTICRTTVPTDDGLQFDAESVAGESIIEAGNYAGVRVRLVGCLGTARIPIQIDVGFGDPLVPGPVAVQLPTLLNFPAPHVQGYSQESAIAEKVQAMVALGEINSRLKDFYDVWLLTIRFAFEEAVLAKAITATFQWRHTAVPIAPIFFTPDFAHDRTRQTQWLAFLERHRLDDAPREFGAVIEVLAAFLQPILEALHQEQSLHRHWLPGGPWHDVD
jgi:hypothetical protein